MTGESHSVFEVDGQEFTVYKAPQNSRKPIRANRIMIRDRHTSYVTVHGKMFSSRIPNGSWYVGERWTIRDINLIEDAIELGVIDPVNIKALNKLKAEEAFRRNSEHAAENLVESAKRLDIALTKDQLRIVNRYLKK